MRRLQLILFCVPLVFILMLCTAAGAAWDEFAGDWRSFKHWLADAWRTP